MSSGEIFFEMQDEKGRPLMAFRSNGLISFYRYLGMSPEDKDDILRMFSVLKKKGLLLGDSEEQTESSVLAYLNYETDEDFCG
ncbi:MAG: hypothetical protein M0R32_11910 [Candidatus Cloacimonetes bacterium]|jgi:hypothetical protein|nr:hypothetical protein [Candidatus Cloacimonadota bacterium]